MYHVSSPPPLSLILLLSLSIYLSECAFMFIILFAYLPQATTSIFLLVDILHCLYMFGIFSLYVHVQYL